MSRKGFMTASELITELGWLHPDCPVHFSPINSAWLGAMGPMRVRRDKRGQANVYTTGGHKPQASADPKDCYAVIDLYEDDGDE